MRSCSYFTRLKKARAQVLSSFSWNFGVRLALVITLITGALLVNFFTLTARAQAASLPTTAQTSSSATHSSATRKPNTSPHARNPAPRYALLKSKKVNARMASTNVVPKTPSASNPLNGLGDLPIYTYVDKKLSDHMDMKVNVANGNLLLHTTELSISGTGLDFNWGGYYNSEANGWWLDHGINWNFSTGRGATLDLSNPSSGVTLYAPSGYAVFFASNGSGGFKDAAAIDASMSYDNGGQTYTLTFHHTGEQWGFNTYGTLVFDYDKNGNLISPSWNDRGDLLQMTDTQNRTITFNQTPDYQISTVTDPINRTITYGYNPNNDFLLSITDLNQNQTTFNYDSNAYLTTVTDPQGNTTTIAYSASGQVTSITDAKNGMTKFTYNNGSTVVTDPLGHTTTYTYNSNLEVLKTTDALGHYGTGTYQNGGYNVTQYSDALTNTSSFQYDTNNNLTSSKDGNGAVTNYTYGSNANGLYYPLTQKDPQSNQTSYAYDSNGNMTSSTDSKTGNVLRYTYNPNGTINTQKDANGNTTSFGYDSQGNRTSITPPSQLGTTTLTYDGLSRITSITDGNGNTTQYSYDNEDRLLNLTYADGSSVAYTYDADGNVLTEVDSTGTTSFQYDELNHLINKTLPGGTVIATGYDAVGNLTGINDGTGTINYTYDAANRMITLTDIDGSKTTYNYDANNHKISILYPNRTGMVITYDKAGHELSTIGGIISTSGGTAHVTTPYDNFQYTYTTGSGANQKPTALVQQVTYLDELHQSSTSHQHFTYDSQNQLTDAKNYNSSNTLLGESTYSYDANGNITRKGNQSGTLTNYSYNAANELTTATTLSTGATVNYSYDANGNQTGLTNGPATTYNAENQAVTVGSDTYTYSGTDQTQRVSVNADTDVYTNLGLSTINNTSGTTEFVRCSCGLLNNERTPDGNKYYYLFDGEGSIVGMTDSSGNDVNGYSYDPYGNINGSKEQSGLNNPWKYAGGYYDSSTNLTKFGIRYYDATTGRWTQRTPVGGSLQETLKANPYVYAGNNPVNATDPSGAFTATFTGAVIACLVGLGTDLIGILKDAAVAGLANVIASIAGGASVEVTLPAVGVIIATAIVGCIAGAAIYLMFGAASGG